MPNPVDPNSPLVLGKDNVVGTAAGAVVILIVWALKQFGNVDLPVQEAMALQLLVQAIVTHLTPSAL